MTAPTPHLGLVAGPDGQLVGRDPRHMTREELEALGHVPSAPLAVKRAKCLDCCGHQPGEVRKCVATSCDLWPYRMGTNPFRRAPTKAQREASRRNAARLHSKPKNPVKATGFVPEHTSPPNGPTRCDGDG